MKDVIQAGLEKLEDYFLKVMHIPAYNFAMILNPKMKLRWYEHHEPHKLEWAKNLFMQELQRYSSAPLMSTIPSQTRDWTDDILEFSGNTVQNTRGNTLQQEFDAYLLDLQVLSSTLLFWQENRTRYPTMFLMAMDILPIQGSSVPCERVFSSGKQTTTDRRSRITPELMEALQMLKFGLKHDVSALNFT
ncbi:uncharacterized protein ARMOST_12922 [Armillaria ostoyae]|uniref:HAT C-terminal dimerisation domain-containing protein n=1 Tax=Armillaria ostoyae TaxID=47428 RepID=A0A284RL99_ARMOS|nr:uncharacterized protein ARMOST_12922 [Armillaria ostoyae]